MTYVLQDPQARLNYSWDWTDWLAEGDSVTSYQWTITPTGPTLTGETTDTVFVSDLELGQVYELVAHVVTATGLEDDRTIVIAAEHT